MGPALITLATATLTPSPHVRGLVHITALTTLILQVRELPCGSCVQQSSIEGGPLSLKIQSLLVFSPVLIATTKRDVLSNATLGARNIGRRHCSCFILSTRVFCAGIRTEVINLFNYEAGHKLSKRISSQISESPAYFENLMTFTPFSSPHKPVASL